MSSEDLTQRDERFQIRIRGLRKRFGEQQVLRGVDLRSVQELLGHADIRTTEIYVRLSRAMRGEIVSPLDEL